MIDPWTHFLVEELIFPEESGGVTGEGAFGLEASETPEANFGSTPHSNAPSPGMRAGEAPTPRSAASGTRSQGRLSVAEARQLITSSNYSLNVDELGGLEPDVATVLARFDGAVNFSFLTSLSAAAAGSFRVHRHALQLNSLAVVDYQTSVELAAHPGRLELDGLADLPCEIAMALAAHRGELSLNGITTISDEAAEALASHVGDVELNGLTELPKGVAIQLARIAGPLHLNGLIEISDEAAEALARRSHPLYLNGLVHASDVAIGSLAIVDSEVSLDELPHIPDAAVPLFAAREWKISLTPFVNTAL